MFGIEINETGLQELLQLRKEANIVNVFYYLEYMKLNFCQILVIPDNVKPHCFQ